MKVVVLVLLLYCFFVSTSNIGAQGVFFSAMDMRQIADPSQASANSFVYRVATSGRYFYYIINLNDLVYRTKNVFPLKGVDINFQDLLKKNIYDSRAKVGTNNYISEVIIHNDFILLDNHRTIYFETVGGVVSLEAMRVPPGLVILTGSNNITLFSQTEEGLVEKGELPMTVVSGDTPEILIAKQPGHIFRQLRVWSESRSVAEEEVVLKAIPNVRIVRKRFSIELGGIESESAKIDYIDSLSNEIREEIKKQQKVQEQFLNSLKSSIEPIFAREDFETDKEFEQREEIYREEYEAVLVAGLRRNDFEALANESNDKLVILESYRSSILRGLQKFYLHEKIDGRIFLNVSTILGRNMPPFTFLQSPSRLLGGNIEFEYVKSVGAVSILGTLGATYSMWKFNSLFEDKSNLKEAKAGVGIGVPLVRDDNRMLMLGIKGVFYYCQYAIKGFSIQEAETLEESVTQYSLYGNEVAFGAEIEISYFFSRLPVSMFLQYGYNNRGFGDLRLGFGLPLVFIPRF